MHATMQKLYRQKYAFKPNKCPNEITLPMLVEEMKSPDTNLETYTKDQLWACYYTIMFPPNKFGLTADLTDTKIPLFYFKETNEVSLFADGTDTTNFKTTKISTNFKTTKITPTNFKTKKLTTNFKTKRIHTKTSKNRFTVDSHRKRKTKGGTVLAEDTRLINPQWQHAGEYWSTVINIDGTDIFGSSIPFQTELECFQTFAFYMYRLEIKRIISLHACATHPQFGYCNQNFTNMENVLWKALTLLDHTRTNAAYTPNYGFEDVFIRDMTAGPINSWLRLNQVPFNDANNRTLIHCAGGYGRTCSALLMLSWKRKYQQNPVPNWPTYENPHNLSQIPYLGFANSRALYDGLIGHFNGRIHVSTDANNASFQDTINLMGNNYPVPVGTPSNIGRMRDEVFYIGDNYHANLFIQRVNRMIMCWASGHLQALIPPGSPPGTSPRICLFPCYTDLNALGNYTPDTIFQQGILTNMLSVNAQTDALALEQFYGPP